ncbi:GNAT family N-acetyltransferase [Candidatus Omnitrophota bacterium]
MKISVDALNSVDKDKVYALLLHAQYGKFNLWPNATDKNIADFLLDEIYKMQAQGGGVLLARRGREITAIAAFRDLEWDTQHFGFKCAKIEYILTDQRLEIFTIGQSLDKILSEFQKFCIKSRTKFVCVSVDSRDANINSALQRVNYHYILTWIDGVFNSSGSIPKIKDNTKISTAIKPEEIEFFKRISTRSYFKGGRFYLDSNFNRQRVDDMYANQINFAGKNNDLAFVYRVKNHPAGLFTYRKIASYKHFSNLQVATGRFLVVDPKFRTKNVGYNLFAKTLEYFQDKTDLVATGLEVHNLPSLNLHAKLGFKFNYSHNVYHWWRGK